MRIKVIMAPNEPPQRKRKVDERTLYVLEEGKFVPVINVSPPPSDSDSEDDDVDPVDQAEYFRQLRESGGFDLDLGLRIGSMLPFKWDDGDEDEMPICAKLALHWFNFQRGSDFQLLRVERYNSLLTSICTYYLTAQAFDPATNSPFVFQTCYTHRPYHGFKIEVETCRIKTPQTQASGSGDDAPHWNYEAVHDFYKAELKWLPDDAFLQTSHQYYQLQDSDIQQNDWLNLYAEYAFFPLWQNRLTKLKFGVPLEIQKVVVQTCEAIESKEKLKAGNAAFYINFRDCDQTEDHRAVVRRTTDGLPGHLILEVKCPSFEDCSIN